METLPEREGTTAADNIHLSSLEEGQNFGGLLRQWHLFHRRFKEQPGLPSLWSGEAYSSGSGHSPLLLLSGSCLIPPGGFNLSHASTFDTNTEPQLPLSLTQGGPSL